MKFQIGDKVVVRHTREEALVVEILGKGMVMLDTNGITFPAYIDELEHPYYQWFTEKKPAAPVPPRKHIDDIPAEKKKAVGQKADGLWFSFLPVSFFDEFGDEIVDTLKVHLVNRTELAYHFQYALDMDGKEVFRIKSEIQPFEDFYLHDIPFEEVNDSPLLCVECSPVKKDKKKKAYAEVFCKLKPKQVFQRIEEMRKKGDALFTHLLMESYPDKEEDIYLPLPEKKASVSIHDLRQIRSSIEPAREVVDLHIEVLAADHEKLSPAEIVQIQLSTFARFLDLAKVHRQRQLVVIHGIGSGKLRDLIHEQLSSDPGVSSFSNRYHPSYGYGATEILFN
jgi:hypothetical protein